MTFPTRPYNSVEISVICPSYNGLDLLKKNLPPLMELLEGLSFTCEFILIDNGSTDSTVEWLRKEFSKVQIKMLSKNEGFSIACNLGARESCGEWLLFINNDILIYNDFISPLLEVGQKHLDSFAITPKLVRPKTNELDDGVRYGLFKDGFLDVLLDEKSCFRNTTTLFFCGGCFIVSREKFLNFGGFDEIYSPFSWEDLDLGYRATKKGLKNYYVSSASVFHQRETTSKKIFSDYEFRSIVWRNKFIFMWSHFLNKKVFFTHLFWLPIKLLKFLFIGRSSHVKGFFMALKSFSYVLRKRSVLKKEAVYCDKNLLKIP